MHAHAEVSASVASSSLAATAAAGSTTRTCEQLTSGGNCTFGPSPTPTTWLVPAGLTHVVVSVTGGAGAVQSKAGAPGAGGLLITTLRVTPGQHLQVYVGIRGQGTQGGSGWGAGGDGAYSPGAIGNGGAGGGASAIVPSGDSNAPLVVAAGGGGGGRHLSQLLPRSLCRWRGRGGR